MQTINVPNDVLEILNLIHEAGEEAYVVGGCVRDALLGVKPHDWDITTSATPQKVKALFRRTVDTGLSHGTITVLVHDEGYEVTTYRVDGKYEDYRRPKEVTFTRSLAEDLLRRDFTINAMAYNHEEGVIDLYNGRGDLEAGIIRCVGTAWDRFNEDALRMLRAIRFSAKLDFEIEESTYKAMKELSHLIQHVSAERINVELTKTLISPNPSKIKELVDVGLIEYIIPEFSQLVNLEQNNPYHKYSVDNHIYESLNYIAPVAHLRWAMYLHDIGKGFTKTTDDNGIDHFYKHQIISEQIAGKTMKALKFDNKTYDRVLKLIRFHDDRFSISKKSVRKAISRIGLAYFDDLLLIKEADIKSQHHDYEEENLGKLKEIIDFYEEILEDNECLSIKDLAINGNDVKLAGITDGKLIGETLKYLLEKVLEDPEVNNKEKLIGLINKRE